jgi:hypothetical protein
MTALIAFVCLEIIAFLGLTGGHCIRAFSQKRSRPKLAVAISTWIRSVAAARLWSITMIKGPPAEPAASVWSTKVLAFNTLTP